MNITKIDGCTRTIGESQGYIGLPLRDVLINDSVNGENTPAMESAWLPSAEDLAALNAGAPIILRVLGTAHPPVMVEAGAKPEVAFYRAGQCRNDDKALSHTYAELTNGEILPMCIYGWNRSSGHALSIFRGSPGTEGDCKLCAKRVRLNLPPVREGTTHHTRWL